MFDSIRTFAKRWRRLAQNGTCTGIRKSKKMLDCPCQYPRSRTSEGDQFGRPRPWFVRSCLAASVGSSITNCINCATAAIKAATYGQRRRIEHPIDARHFVARNQAALLQNYLGS